MIKKIILIGTGPMALDYAKVLAAQEQSFQVIGRGSESALRFEEISGIKPLEGGFERFLENNPDQSQTFFIVATGTEMLMPVLKKLLMANAAKVLIEKPAALSISELLENRNFLEKFSSKIFVAYNRRFYASVKEVQRLIKEDGGLQSMHFEFTEWAHKIEPLTKAPGVKENWFFANSTHVVDLAFHLAGNPKNWNTFSAKGEILWHDKTNFAGAGITENNVLFSYLSNWESAGRWAIELFTNKRRIYLKPMEEIYIQEKGTLTLDKHEFDDALDKTFKPGLFLQIQSFLENTTTGQLLTMDKHMENTERIYARIIQND